MTSGRGKSGIYISIYTERDELKTNPLTRERNRGKYREYGRSNQP